MAEKEQPAVMVTKIYVIATRDTTINDALEAAKELARREDCLVILTFFNKEIQVRRDTNIREAIKDYQSSYTTRQ